MAKTPDQPMILFHIEWMPLYESLSEKIPNPTFEWTKNGGEAHEAFNFRVERDGRCYGFVQVAEDKTINISRLGNPIADDTFVDGVTAVWIAKHPTEGGLRVVGWYRNATIFRKPQSCPPHMARNFQDGWDVYSVSADAADVTFRSEKQRDIPDLTGLGSIVKRTKQFYISQRQDDFCRKTEAKIWTAIFGEKGERKDKSRRGRATIDAERRKLIEDAAIAHAKSHYGKPGITVKSVEDQNCGFDLLAIPEDGESLCIEVKGRSISEIRADFSVNEYDHILLMQNDDFRQGEYVICIVTNALDEDSRTLHDYRWRDGKWRHSKTGKPLFRKELTAVRFYADGVEATD